jgi:hypothetical protein
MAQDDLHKNVWTLGELIDGTTADECDGQKVDYDRKFVPLETLLQFLEGLTKELRKKLEGEK